MDENSFCKIIKKDGKLLLTMPNGEVIPKQLSITAYQDTDMTTDKDGIVEVDLQVKALIQDAE